MSDIGFYHLTRTGPEQALPALLGRTLAAGKRAVIRCVADRIASVDTALWVCPEPDWLPHGTAAMGAADLQPIWITDADDAPNGATFLFLLDGQDSARLAAYERVFDLFDGGDENAVAAARVRWKAAKAAGHALTYWQQGPRGWERK
jgi:DNA polymerase-3 subunit chi